MQHCNCYLEAIAVIKSEPAIPLKPSTLKFDEQNSHLLGNSRIGVHIFKLTCTAKIIFETLVEINSLFEVRQVDSTRCMSGQRSCRCDDILNLPNCKLHQVCRRRSYLSTVEIPL